MINKRHKQNKLPRCKEVFVGYDLKKLIYSTLYTKRMYKWRQEAYLNSAYSAPFIKSLSATKLFHFQKKASSTSFNFQVKQQKVLCQVLRYIRDTDPPLQVYHVVSFLAIPEKLCLIRRQITTNLSLLEMKLPKNLDSRLSE